MLGISKRRANETNPGNAPILIMKSFSIFRVRRSGGIIIIMLISIIIMAIFSTVFIVINLSPFYVKYTIIIVRFKSRKTAILIYKVLIRYSK